MNIEVGVVIRDITEKVGVVLAIEDGVATVKYYLSGNIEKVSVNLITPVDN